MTKKHEELIGEIALLFCDLCKGFNVLSGDCTLGYSPRPCPGARVPAHQAITLILSAVRDGLEIPDEIERRYVSSFYDEVGACTFTGTYDLDDLIIALRKE